MTQLSKRIQNWFQQEIQTIQYPEGFKMRMQSKRIQTYSNMESKADPKKDSKRIHKEMRRRLKTGSKLDSRRIQY